MSKLVAYLGGPIAGCTKEEIHSWREHFKQVLSDRYEFLDPTHGGLYADGLQTSEDIVTSDKAMIDRSDLVIINAWKPSVGSIMEMMYAYTTGKPVLLIHPHGALPVNPWYVVHASIIVFSVSAAFITMDDENFMSEVINAGLYHIATDQGPVPVPRGLVALSDSFLALVRKIGTLNDRWWLDPRTQEPIDRNFGEMLMLTVSELGESMNAYRPRTKPMDDHLINRTGYITEMYDAIIRLADMLGHLQGPTDSRILAEKLAFNAHRADHKHENRLKDDGKTC